MDRAATVETICERLASGETLVSICRSDGLPTTRTFLRWADDDDSVAEEYRCALAARAEWYAAEHERIRLTAVDRETAAAARVQLTALEWQLQRMAPKRYGDRLDVEVGVKVDLGSVLERRRQRVIEANARLGIAGPDEAE
jgi:hypothetical protein